MIGRSRWLLTAIVFFSLVATIYVVGIRPSANTIVRSVTIDFDEQTKGLLEPETYADLGLTITSNGRVATLWDTDEASSSPNFLVGENSFQPIEIAFTEPTTVGGVTVVSAGHSAVTVTTFDQAGAILETYTVSNPDGEANGLGNRDPITFAASQSTTLLTFVSDLASSVDGFGIDDLTFSRAPVIETVSGDASLGSNVGEPHPDVTETVTLEEPTAPPLSVLDKPSEPPQPTEPVEIPTPTTDTVAPAPTVDAETTSGPGETSEVKETPTSEVKEGPAVTPTIETPSTPESAPTPPAATVTETSPPPPSCGGRPATIIGTDGNDTLIGTDGPDVIVGLGGADWLRGLGGNDRLCGGDGNDWLDVDSADSWIDGGEGSDVAEAKGDGGVTIDLATSGIEKAIGGPGDDVFDATLVTVVVELSGHGGNDTLIGGAGADSLHGHAGDDTLVGNGGNDWLSGGDGSDVFDGGDGNDWLYIDGVDQSIRAGSGRDRADVQGSQAVVLDLDDASLEVVMGGPGDDILDGTDATNALELSGNGGDDLLIGGLGSDTLHGYAGNDTVIGNGGNDWLTGSEGRDEFDGGGGDDWLYIEGDDGQIRTGEGRDRADVYGTLGITLDLAESDLEIVTGGPGDDVLDGSGMTANLELLGWEGDDRLIGGSGNDTLHGHEGADHLIGLGGNDWLTGGGADDHLDGGEGSDWLSGNAGTDDCQAGEFVDTCEGPVATSPSPAAPAVTTTSAPTTPTVPPPSATLKIGQVVQSIPDLSTESAGALATPPPPSVSATPIQSPEIPSPPTATDARPTDEAFRLPTAVPTPPPPPARPDETLPAAQASASHLPTVAAGQTVVIALQSKEPTTNITVTIDTTPLTTIASLPPQGELPLTIPATLASGPHRVEIAAAAWTEPITFPVLVAEATARTLDESVEAPHTPAWFPWLFIALGLGITSLVVRHLQWVVQRRQPAAGLRRDLDPYR